MAEITIPFNYEPRFYQRDLFNCLDDGYRRAISIIHRRAGKDKTLLNLLVKESFKRVGSYFYLFPTYNQGRKVLWDGMDNDGFKYLKHIPEETRAHTNNQEMKLTLKNESIIQVVGTDNVDAIMGTNPVGCVFSEYSLQNPIAWDLIQPILIANGGWAVFNYTPRGRNHGFTLWQQHRNDPDWYSELKTVIDTKQEHLAIEARKSGMAEAMIQQEFYCSFEASLASCFFAGVLEGHRYVAKGEPGRLFENERRELEFRTDYKGNIELWRFPYFLSRDWDDVHWTNRYVVGTDISEGLARDWSVAYVFDRLSREFVCRMRSNTTDAHVWAHRVFALARYYENALIVPERNGAGQTTVKELLNLKANIYAGSKPNKVRGGILNQFGWNENRDNKQILCGDLRNYLAGKPYLYDNLLLEECATFVVDDNDRLGADKDFHDDCVIAAGLCLQGDQDLPKPEALSTPAEGWRERLLKGSGGSAWAA